MPAVDLVDRLAWSQSTAVAAACVGTALIFWRRALDSQGTFKASVVFFAAVVLLGLIGGETVLTRRLTIPWGPAPLMATLFIAGATVAMLASDNRWRSLIGPRGRVDGLLLYLAVTVVFLCIVRLGDRMDVPILVTTLALGAFIVALIGIAQRLGVDPFSLDNATYGSRAVTATLGNPNFVSGYLGAAIPLSCWLALTLPARRSRWLAWGATALSALGILLSASIQGALAAAVGLGLLALVWMLGLARARRTQGFVLLGAVAFVLVTVVGLALAHTGPLAGETAQVGVQQRLNFWHAAVKMVEEKPLTGQGMARFAGHYREERSPTAALQFGIGDTADEPHSVPLGMFVSGGVGLGLLYLGFVASVGWSLVRGLIRLDGTRRLALAAVGGAWLGYQVQAAISIDMPPLALLHYVLAACVVVLAGDARCREFAVGAQPVRRSGRGKRLRDQQPSRAGVVVVALATLVGLWFASAPLRSELWGASALAAARSNHGTRAVNRMDRAARVSPREAAFRAEAGRLLLQAGRPDLALSRYERAVALEPTSLPYVMSYARLLTQANRLPDAEHWYHVAIELEPVNVEPQVELAKVLLLRRQPRDAQPLLEHALTVHPGDVGIRLALADAAWLLDDPAGATRIYGGVLAERPDDVDLVLSIAQAWVRRGQPERGVALIQALQERVATTTTSLPRIVAALGSAYEAEGRTQEAIALYQTISSFTEGQAALRRLGLLP